MDNSFEPAARENRRGGPVAGVIVFVVTFALMFVAAFVQYMLGTWGLALTELMLAGVALAAAAILRLKPREAFPFKLPAGRHIGATLLIWAGYLGFSLSSTMALAHFFPEQVFGVNEQISDVFAPMPLVLALLLVALLPAVCEEMLFRGFIQHTFRRVRPRWVAIVAVAVMFGIMHMSVYRFAATAILGIALAYLREKSGGLALPMLLHFVNNAFSVTASRLAGAGGEAVGDAAATLTGAVLPLMFFYSIASPLLIWAGCALFDAPPPLGERRRMPRARKLWLAVAIAATALLALGFALTAGSLLEAAGV